MDQAASGANPEAASSMPAFRRATVADAPAMLGVIESAFERWPRFDIPVTPLEHLQWKMQPPVGVPPTHTLGELDGRVVAVEVRWMSECSVGGETWLANVGADKAILPAYQGRGFNRLLNTAEARTPQPGRIGIETPSRNVRILRTRGDEPRAARELRVWVRPLDLRMVAALTRTGGVVAMLPSLPAVLGLRRPSTTPMPGTHIRAIDRFDERADALWTAARGAFDVLTVRSSTYLNWRYADPRAGRTLILGAFAGATDVADGGSGELLAYAAFRRSGTHVDLVDVFAHPEHREVVSSLVAEGCAQLRDDGARIVTAWLPPAHPDCDALRAAGFVQVGAPLKLEFDAPPGQEGEPGWDARFSSPTLRVHVTLGDFDFA